MLPFRQVFGAEKVVHASASSPDFSVLERAGQCIVTIVLLPDAGIEDAVGRAILVYRNNRDHRIVRMLLPVKKKRVGSGGDAVARPGAVVDGDDPVRLDQRLPAIAVPFLIGIQGGEAGLANGRDRRSPCGPSGHGIADRV
jgi:hypothetical protein